MGSCGGVAIFILIFIFFDFFFFLPVGSATFDSGSGNSRLAQTSGYRNGVGVFSTLLSSVTEILNPFSNLSSLVSDYTGSVGFSSTGGVTMSMFIRFFFAFFFIFNGIILLLEVIIS